MNKLWAGGHVAVNGPSAVHRSDQLRVILPANWRPGQHSWTVACGLRDEIPSCELRQHVIPVLTAPYSLLILIGPEKPPEFPQQSRGFSQEG
jgi:hypothetical protein